MEHEGAEQRRPSIRQVAEAAQVSPTTVSLALRGAARIPEATRARVRAAAEALNYIYAPREGRSARATVRRIGFVMHNYGHRPVSSNPFFSEVLQGAEEACAEQEASLTLSVLLHDHAPSNPLPAALRPGEVHGLLLNGPYPAAMIARLEREVGCPIVLIDNTGPLLPYDSIMANDFRGGYLATHHLITRGRSPVVFVVGQPQIPSLQERQRGYVAACADAGQEPQPPLRTSQTWDPATIRRELAPQLLALPRPFGLFCAVDDYAVAALSIFQEHNIAVPAEVAVVGFDDLEATRRLTPQLSSVLNNPRTMGRLAVQRLLARLDGDEGPQQHLLVGVELVARQTS